MKNLLKKFSGKKYLGLLGALVFVMAIALLPQVALAAIDIADYITSALGHLALGIINLLGSLILLPLINFVVWILSYNSFLDNNAVIIGWPLVRDLCNMFFVVILLFIAFGTILNIPNYSYKSTLPKLLLMAILINFSKTIMGFAIDFAQVIMLTFVNSFRDAAAVNLIHAFGIRDMLKLDLNGDNFNNWEVVGVSLLGVILLVIAVGLMLAYAAVLLWRVISLWVLIILSPVAFLMSAFPSGQKYASEIWSKFVEQLTTGVILAFFMWLSFSILASGYSVESQGPVAKGLLGNTSGAAGSANERGAVYGSDNISSDVQWERLYTFIIAVALLLLALQYAQKAGGFAGSFAGKVSGKLSELGVAAAKLPYKAAKFGLNEGIDKLYEKTPIDLNMKRNWERIKNARASRKHTQLQKGEQRAEKSIQEGNWLTARMAMATGGMTDHYTRYGMWKGIGKLVPGLGKVGKKGQEASDAEVKEGERIAEEIREREGLIKDGGSSSRYLEDRSKNIDEEINPKQSRHDELEELSKNRALTPEESTELQSLKTDLTNLQQEKVDLKVHLSVVGFDFQRLDELEKLSKTRPLTPEESAEQSKGMDLLHQQIKKFNDDYQKALKEAADLNTDLATLQSERNNIALSFTPADIARKKELDEQIKEKTLKQAEKQKEISSTVSARSKYGLTNYDGVTTMDVGKLDVIRTQAMNTRTTEVTSMSSKYHTEKIGEIEKKLKDPKISTEDKEKLEKEKIVLETQLSAPTYLTDEDKKTQEEKVKELRKKQEEVYKKSAQYRPTVGFEAQRAQRAGVAEEYKKVENVESDEELISMAREAQATKNHNRLAAVLKKLANDGNFNEIINAYGYTADFKGNQRFFKEQVHGVAGVDEQATISLASDVSFINELRNGHYGMSRSSKMKNGVWEWLSEAEHAQIRVAQILKKGSRDIASRHNRLAFGGEDSAGNFHIDLGGAVTLRQITSNWAGNDRLVNEQMNPNLAIKLLSAELKYGELTKALAGKMHNGLPLVVEIVRQLKKKVGSTSSEVEELNDSIATLKGRY
ncbi:MAG: hypothetical protein Q8P32_03825 [Candidatus Komeilibacteria bacterium]|nr:hypothetical protein [Candidatus Komeilibacteria bacterium]